MLAHAKVGAGIAVTVGVASAILAATLMAGTPQGSVGDISFHYADAGNNPTPLTSNARALCDADERLIGAGLNAGGAASFSQVHIAKPVDDGDPGRRANDGFRSRISYTSGGLSGAEAQAVCSPRNSQVVSRARRIDPGGTVTATVTCPRGTKVSGGGGAADSTAVRLNSSFPLDIGDANTTSEDGWGARVFNASGAERKITAYAICTKREMAYGKVESELADTGLPSLTELGCPELGQVVLSAGARFSGGQAAAARVLGLVATDGDDAGFIPGDEATFRVIVDSGDPQMLTRHVLCAA